MTTIPIYEMRYDVETNLPSLDLIRETEFPGGRVRNSEDACYLFQHIFRPETLCEEHGYLLCLDSHYDPLALFQFFHGTNSAGIFEVADLILRTVLTGARSIVICHNHPAGDPLPSSADMEALVKLDDALSNCGIRLLDHIIIGRKNWVSMFLLLKEIKQTAMEAQQETKGGEDGNNEDCTERTAKASVA